MSCLDTQDPDGARGSNASANIQGDSHSEHRKNTIEEQPKQIVVRAWGMRLRENWWELDFRILNVKWIAWWVSDLA